MMEKDDSDFSCDSIVTRLKERGYHVLKVIRRDGSFFITLLAGPTFDMCQAAPIVEQQKETNVTWVYFHSKNRVDIVLTVGQARTEYFYSNPILPFLKPIKVWKIKRLAKSISDTQQEQTHLSPKK